MVGQVIKKKTNQALSIELYKSDDFTNILANTYEITKRREIYRFNFHSIDTYTLGFSSESSITQIISEGDTTNGANINTTLTDILSRLIA